ncbi:sensor histidine kinase [Sphingomonas lenta]|uniref:Histidine kinase n=1 Tax=Sphingomonas lenta TaxID=1141887 RepID=A0A2A2SJ69_9SPHN|nr:sensor histidine kinase [Sphingomonas lenta]PAX09200.1 histidine kinase [Sphingomonas lenta]
MEQTVLASSAATPPGTAGDLRRLYREAEARAARLRLLVEAGRRLAGAQGPALDGAAAGAAQAAAFLMGYARGRVVRSGDALDPTDCVTLALLPPGSAGGPVGTLALADRLGPSDGSDAEDRAAVDVLLQLIAGALAARDREERLAGLLAELFSAQERERAHVARELHDGVAQVATAALRRAELAEASGEPADIARAAELMRTTVTELRRVIAGMRPTALDDLGLAAAIERLAADLGDEGYEVGLSLELVSPLPLPLEAGLFRVAQEALNNVRMHAGGPCRVDVALWRPADRAEVALSVRDAGRGFAPDMGGDHGREHLGLAFMRERVAALGGTLRVDAAPGAGVRVMATVPAA